jgi:hypothetical protein
VLFDASAYFFGNWLAGRISERDECRRDGRLRCSQEINKHHARIQIAEASGLEHAAQNLLGIGAAGGAIAAGDLAIHHRGPDRVLGAPVRRVQRRVKEEAEERVQFRGQMRRQTPTVTRSRRVTSSRRRAISRS